MTSHHISPNLSLTPWEVISKLICFLFMFLLFSQNKNISSRFLGHSLQITLNIPSFHGNTFAISENFAITFPPPPRLSYPPPGPAPRIPNYTHLYPVFLTSADAGLRQFAELGVGWVGVDKGGGGGFRAKKVKQNISSFLGISFFPPLGKKFAALK